MTVEQVINNINSLSLDEKIYLLANIQQSIRVEEKEAQYQKRINKYVDTMKGLAGEAFLKNKRRGHVNGKVVLAICMMEDGFNLTTTAHIIGVDHSTISHYKKVWETVTRYPRIYSDVIMLYNKYREELCKQTS